TFMKSNFALVIPMANEQDDFHPFIDVLVETLDTIGNGTVFFVGDNVSKDKTLDLCKDLSAGDQRFHTIWAPENRNLVDAYIRGYKEALKHSFDFIIEMDAGLSHDPRALPMFLRVLNEGNECAFGSRFINGGSTADSAWNRKFLSKFGTFLSNALLGTDLKDMTSGYQGFHRNI